MAPLTHQELEQLGRDLASFARANIPMPEGLRQLSATLQSSRLRKVYMELAEAMARGTALSEAMRQTSVPLPADFAAAIACAEKSGDMISILNFTVEQARRIKRHHSAMITALVYPVTVMILALLIVYFITTVILPKFQDMFAQLGAERLPGPTHLLVSMAYYLHGVRGFMVVALLVGALAGWLILAARRDMAPFLLRWVELFQPLMSLSDAAIMMRYLGVMVSRGVPLAGALRAASLSVWLKRTRRALLAMASASEKGHPVGPLLEGVVPPTAAYVFRQAEDRGNIADACDGIAEYCEDRFDANSVRIHGFIEPVLILMLGIIIGSIIICLYLPLFEIGQHIR